MTNARQAYEALGLEEDASIETVEKKYNMLLKKYHTQISDTVNENDVDLDKLNSAYKFIKDLDYEKGRVVTNSRWRSLLRKVGLDDKKVANFVHYYKFPALAILIGLLILGSFAATMITNKNPDLNIVYAGNYKGKINENFKEKIVKESQNVSKAGVTLIPLQFKQSNSINAAYMKTVTLYNAYDIDVIIMDKEVFDFFQREELLKSLDGFDNIKQKKYKFKAKDNRLKIYGIDVTSSKFLSNDNVKGKIKIAAIPAKNGNLKHAEEFIKIIIK